MFDIIRIVLGGVVVLFLPGFVWSYVFFDKNKIDVIERVTLSIAFSIALVTLLVFWLNRLLDVKITLTNVSLSITGLIIAGIFILYFKRRENEEEELENY